MLKIKPLKVITAFVIAYGESSPSILLCEYYLCFFINKIQKRCFYLRAALAPGHAEGDLGRQIQRFAKQSSKQERMKTACSAFVNIHILNNLD